MPPDLPAPPGAPQDTLIVPVEFTVTGEVRRASSDCCGAMLRPDRVPYTYACRDCGSPCERVLGDPEVVTLHG